ncbi:usp33 [Symbiodinium natans]|uniref:Usp33 protein n=1 Tax=Symbiodinium natans TaxID=878477 RepID=A0A812PCL9_9DINO|nr:usp33 [Symbiodinium natans]
MNAALQCLTHTHGMQKYFRHCEHAFSPRAQSSRQKLLMAFAHWFEQDWGKNVSAPYHSPEDVLRAVQQLNPTFQGYAQQDSQEFLRCVLDNIHEELRRKVPDEAYGSQHHSSENGTSSASDAGPSAQKTNSGTPKSSATDFLASGGEAIPQGSSAAQQLIQFCQGPESSTDAGEIRLSSACSDSRSSDNVDGLSASGQSATGNHSQGATGGSSEPELKTHFESIVSELFQGKIVSCVRCLECRQISRTSEAVYDVSVPIPNANEAATSLSDGSPLSSVSSSPSLQRQGSGGLRSSSWSGVLNSVGGKVKSWFYDKGVHLTDCLRRYCAPEYLGGKDQYFCERCKRKNDCEKRMVFKELPEVLCIHLKRFRFDNAYGWFNGSKNSRVVTFPVTTHLDMSPFMEEVPSQPIEYRLIGLIQHIGSMGGGHYISYCQHKRRPQDWYEFDDVQVTCVTSEQVERAEPYVLFYQRVPSRAAKFDRQTFKKDMRCIQEQVNHYLISQSTQSTSSSSRPGRSSEDGQATSPHMPHALQAVTEEIRNQGPAVRNLYRFPPPELDMAFVSKHWYVRLTAMSHPGPIDNYEYLCPHGMLGYSSAEMAAEPFFPISRKLSQSLIGKYGGGPEISNLDVCSRCQMHIDAYNQRKQAEFDLVSKYDTKDTGDGQGWYLVNALWVNNWKRYVKGEPVHSVQDMCAPGPITNEPLFDKDDPQKLRKNLRLKLDYIGVNARVWWLFMHVHGGGPAIVRDELEIYSKELSVEADLVPEELCPAGNDFAVRSSKQFVDECHGDMESLTQCFLVLGRLKKIAAAAAVDMAQSKELEFMLWLFVLFDVGS